MSATRRSGVQLVVHASEDGFVALGKGADETGVEIDPRDEGLVQNMISNASMGATDMNIGLGRQMPGTYHIKHHHPHGSEFYYIISGRCILHIDGADVEADPGTAVYIPPGAVHGMRNVSDEPCDLIYGLSRGNYSDMGLVYDE